MYNLDKFWTAAKTRNYKKLFQSLNVHPFSAKCQEFLSQYCKTIGFNKYNKFCQILLQNKLINLAILAYIMLGHRSYDKNEIKTMRKAYTKAIKLARDRKNAQEWLYAAYYYWAKHDPDINIKLECVRNSILIPDFSGFCEELVNSKYKRALAWLMTFGGPEDQYVILRGLKSLNRMCELGKISSKKYKLFLKSRDKLKTWFDQDTNP